MINPLKNLITRIPAEYKQEFIQDIYRENLLRSLIAAIVMIMAETVIIIFFDSEICDTDFLEYSIIVYNILFFPALSVVYKKNDVGSNLLRRTVCLAYLSGLLIQLCALSVIPQDEFASINTYVMAIFGIAAFMYIYPIESLVMYVSVYMGFFIALPFFQPDERIVIILRVNALLLNIFAWVLSRFVFRLKARTFIDQRVIEQKNTILREMVIRDPMTSLLNHDHAYKKLGEEMNKAKRIGYPLSLMMVDIDDFKNINDRFGHQVGDEVIVQVADILADTCRITDIVCRYGGEEYMLILPGTSVEDAQWLGERIRMKVEATEFVNEIRVTVSGGISEFCGESAKELIYRADRQLYKAKYNGKNRFMTAGDSDYYPGNPTLDA